MPFQWRHHDPECPCPDCDPPTPPDGPCKGCASLPGLGSTDLNLVIDHDTTETGYYGSTCIRKITTLKLTGGICSKSLPPRSLIAFSVYSSRFGFHLNRISGAIKCNPVSGKYELNLSFMMTAAFYDYLAIGGTWELDYVDSDPIFLEPSVLLNSWTQASSIDTAIPACDPGKFSTAPSGAPDPPPTWTPPFTIYSIGITSA